MGSISGRPRSQCGQLLQESGRWSGRYYAYSGGTRKRKRVPLGFMIDTTKTEAQRLLREVIDRDNRHESAMLSLRTRGAIPLVGVPVGGKYSGWAAELVVAADLTAKGHAVYRPLIPNGPFDLLFHDGAGFQRVEVKFASDKWMVKLKGSIRRNLGKFDVLAVVGEDGRITYLGGEDVSALLKKGAKLDRNRTVENANG